MGMNRKPEGEGFRPQVGSGEGRPPADRRPVDRRPPRRFERPAGDAGEKPEGGEFSVEKWVHILIGTHFNLTEIVEEKDIEKHLYLFY